MEVPILSECWSQQPSTAGYTATGPRAMQLPNDGYSPPPGFLPISFNTSLTILRSTNWFRSGSGFPWGQPSSGVVRDSKRSLISSGGISGLYLNHQIAFVLNDILMSLMVPPGRGMLTY